jgi:hypothetical protein
MKLKNFKINDNALYWGLIITFTILYFFVGLVSTIHAFSFFQLANSSILALLLAIGFELGQSSVLFSLLMTKNKDKFLPWLLMFGLSAVQITGNVFASFKHLSTSGSNDWLFWQKTILFGVQVPNAEMYQVIIAYLQGAILPLVALGMVALVVQNVKHFSEEQEPNVTSIPDKDNEFEPVDLTNIEPDVLTNVQKEIIKIVNKNDTAAEVASDVFSSNDDLDKEVIDLTSDSSKDEEELENGNLDEILTKELNSIESPKSEIEIPEITEQIAKNFIVASELAKEKSGKKEPTLHRDDFIVLKRKSEAKKIEIKKPIVSEQFDKDFIIHESPKKKRGRLFKKQKEEKVIELKKELEVLPIIETIENPNKEQDKESYNNEIKSDLVPLETTEMALKDRTNQIPYINEHGVEIVDVKAIEKPEEIKKN